MASFSIRSLLLALWLLLSMSDVNFGEGHIEEANAEGQCLNDDASQTCDSGSNKPEPSFFEEAVDTTTLIESTATISPTAHYTSYIMYKNGLGAPGLYTTRGWIYYHLLRPFDWFISLDILFDRGLSIARQVVHRHMMMDYLLEQRIKSGDVIQVVELACGLSSRGYRISRKYPHVKYIETDLTSMVETKRQIFMNANMLRENHKLMVLDALHDVDYSKKLKDLLLGSDGIKTDDQGSDISNTTGGTAVITEGLLTYFNREDAEQIVNNIFTFLKKRSGADGTGFGMYLSNMHIATYYQNWTIVQFFRRFLSFFVKREIDFQFQSDEDVLQMLRNHGATNASLHNPEDYHNTIDDGQNDGNFPRITKLKSEKSTRGIIRILEGSI